MKERQTGLAGENINSQFYMSFGSEPGSATDPGYDSSPGSSSADDELHSNMRIKVNNSTIVDCKQMKR